MKSHGDPASLALDRGNAQALAHGFEYRVLQKVFYRYRRGAKAVCQLLSNVLLVLFGGDRRNALVRSQAEVFAGNVILGDSNVEAEAERGTQLRRGFLALQFRNGALQHLAVHVKTDGFNVAMLLPPEHVSCAAQFEVEGGDSKACAQFAEFLHGREALSRDVREHGLGRNEEIRVCALARTPDAPSQLVELREAEAIGAIDQNRVGARDVQSIFDDGRGHQHIRFIADEFQHHAFEFFFAHLAMRDDDARFRNELRDHGAERINGLDAIVNEEDLPFSRQFRLDCALDQLFLKGRDNRLNREAVARRRFDEGHITKADEGHVQGARNRRRGKRQRVDILAHLFQSFFVSDAEALFFIHDEEAEVGEFHVFRKQPMRADDHVHLAGFQIREDFLLLRGAAKTAEHFDVRAEGRESLLEGFEVLEGEYRGRRQKRDLFVIREGFERRAHGHFRLAVADVAAEQPVHRLGALHIALDVADGGDLVVSFLEFESVLELALKIAVRRKRKSRRRFALRVESEQLIGHVFDRFARARFARIPGGAAEFIQRRMRTLEHTVVLDQIHSLQRDIKPRVVGVFEEHELAAMPVGFDQAKPFELTDAVVHVHDEIAGLQLGEVAEEAGGSNLAAGALDGWRDVEEIRMAVESQLSFRKRDAFRKRRANQ